MANKLETDITLNLKGDLVQKANRYGREMTKLGSRSEAAFSMISSSAAAASRGIDRFGNRLMVSAGVAAVAFERTFIKTAAEFERYQVMLNKLQGSEAEGAKALEWIEEFTQNTPFAVNEVTQSFIRLKTYGLDPMDGTMQAIVDSAAMMGGTAETVDGLSTAIGQAMSKGKLQAEEMNQLLERGIPVYDYLQKISKDLGHNNGLGKTVEQIKADAEAGMLGKETIELLIKEMGRQAQGAAKAQMDTWNGMISNMGDHWKLFQRDVMQSGTFDLLKDELGEFLDMLDEMKESGEYDEFVEKVGKDLVDGFKAAAEAAREIKAAGQEIIPVVKEIGSMASAMVDVVGGYGNLAKIMASIYAINKMIRVSSPILQAGQAAGGFVLDKLAKGDKGGAIGQAASSLGAQRVFVVNMPANGFGGVDVGPDGKTKSKTTPKGRWWTGAALAANSAFDLASPYLKAAGPAAALTLLGSAKDYDASNPTFTPMAFPELPKAKAALDEQMKASMHQFNQAQARPNTTWGMAGQQGNIKLQIDVSDERVKVTPKYVPPGFSIDPDAGAN